LLWNNNINYIIFSCSAPPTERAVCPFPAQSSTPLIPNEESHESDDSSLGEYDETEETKFNEDGSFIGIYGGKKDAEGGGDAIRAGAPAPALQTFV